VTAQPTDALEVVALAHTSPAGWGETDVKAEAFEFHDGVDLKGPVSIAAAAEAKEAGTRLVIVGDSDFAINGQVRNAGNEQLLLATVNWLTERETLIAIGPKVIQQTALQLSNVELRNLFWESLVGLPALGVLLGGSVWWRRRK
jgi:ABC-type uncharacterized transport system involved in gliding motility auxiliary subunit